MRQVRDSLVWLAMIFVVAAVIYVTPRVANYVRASEADHVGSSVTTHEVALDHHHYHHHHAVAPAR